MSPETIRQYQAEFDQLPPQNHHEQQWFEWRAARLTDFLARMYQGVKAIRPPEANCLFVSCGISFLFE